MSKPMRGIDEPQPIPEGFWPYVEAIPRKDFGRFDFREADIRHAWTDESGRWHHVLLSSSDPDVFMAIVVDSSDKSILGHHLLDMPLIYGLRSKRGRRRT